MNLFHFLKDIDEEIEESFHDGKLLENLRRFLKILIIAPKRTAHRRQSRRFVELFRTRRLAFLAASGIPACMIWIAFELCNPFNIAESSVALTRDAAEYSLAPFHQGLGQDRVAVVLYDDESLRARKASWPLAYADYAETLDKIRSQHPKAIFIDLLFDSRREDPTIRDLTEEIQTIRREGIPVYLAAIPKAMPRPELAEMSVPVDVTSIGDTNYLLSGCAREGEGEPETAAEAGSDMPSPALALYQATAQGYGVSASTVDAVAKRRCEVMSLRWGATISEPARGLTFGSRQDCLGSGASWWARLGSSLSRLAELAFIGESASAPRQPKCQYIATLPEDGLDDHRTSQLLRDKIVILGASYSGNRDVVVDALNIEYPGAAMHATALDNLFTFGPDYYSPIGGRHSYFAWMILASILIFFCSGVARWYIDKIARRDHLLIRILRGRIVFAIAKFLFWWIFTIPFILLLSWWTNVLPGFWASLYFITSLGAVISEERHEAEQHEKHPEERTPVDVVV